MANISSFPTAIPSGDDLILGSQTDVAGTPSTKNFTVQSVVDLSSTTSNTGTPFTINATAGGTSTYSSTVNTILLNWTGGGGTYELTLPLASSVPYRIIRVINNSWEGFDFTQSVHLVGQGTDTIDGNAFYNLNRQYSGAQVWSSGTEWIVIQDKS